MLSWQFTLKKVWLLIGESIGTIRKNNRFVVKIIMLVLGQVKF